MTTRSFVLGFALVLLATGCAENRASFFVQGILEMDENCDAEPSEDGPFITQGVLDVAVRDGYVIQPLLRNQLSPRGDSQSLVAETNGIQLEGANIWVWAGTQAGGNTLAQPIFQPTALYIPPGGFANCPLNVLSSEAYRVIVENEVTLFTVGVEFLGITSGNVELEAPRFDFTVNVCSGCQILCTTFGSEDGLICGEGSSPVAPEDCPGFGEPFDCCAYFQPSQCSSLCGVP